MKMLRRGGQCAWQCSRAEASPHGLSGHCWVGQPCTEQCAVPADGNCPQSLPQPPHPGVWWPLAAPGPDGGVPQAAPARPPAGPLKREWGARRQPTSWERLLNMQMDIQEVSSNTSV